MVITISQLLSFSNFLRKSSIVFVLLQETNIMQTAIIKMEIHKTLLFLLIKFLQFCQKPAITTHIIYFNVYDVNIQKRLLRSSGNEQQSVERLFENCLLFDVIVNCSICCVKAKTKSPARVILFLWFVLPNCGFGRSKICYLNTLSLLEMTSHSMTLASNTSPSASNLLSSSTSILTLRAVYSSV